MDLSLIKILLVEDDLVDQMAFTRLSREHDSFFNYKMASTFAQAKEYLKKESFDVVISDYFLGDGTAFDVIEIAKNTPTIFITGVGDEEIAVKALRSGACDYLIKDDNRNYLKILPITITNAHQRRQNEQEIKKLSLVASKTDNAIIIADKNGIIEWVNDGFKRLSEYELKDVQGTSGELLRKGQPTGITFQTSLMEQFLKDKKTISYEAKNFKKSGTEYWVFTTITPLLDNDGNIEKIIAIDADISERKKNEAAIIEARKEAEDAKKTQEEFLANTSHEIRTPMNGIIGMTNLLMETNPNEEQLEYLNAIKLSANNLLSIINDILDFSKIKSGKIEFESINFKIRDVFNNIIKVLHGQAEIKNLLLNTSIDSRIPHTINGDPTRLQQVLINLLANAIKFTEKGEVQLIVDLVEDKKETLTINFSVKDTGIGIPADKLDSIFESFKQASTDTNRRFGGTGLGLTITKKLIESKGGKICVKSEVKKGSTFSFSLDFNKASQENIVDSKKATFKRFQYPIRILLAEDNEINQAVAANIIKKWGGICETVNNGKEALDKLKVDQDFQMVLMDVRMPEMDGYETSREIRKLDSKIATIPIVAITASAHFTEKNKCIEAGMNDYISKPFAPEILYSKILKYTEGATSTIFEESKDNVILKNNMINLKELYELSQGEQGFVDEIIGIFLTNTPIDLETLKRAEQSMDWHLVGEIAHKLYPTAVILGLNEIKNEIKELEINAFQNKNLEKIPELLRVIEKGYQRAFVELALLNAKKN